jgi:hypothetical protein
MIPSTWFLRYLIAYCGYNRQEISDLYSKLSLFYPESGLDAEIDEVEEWFARELMRKGNRNNVVYTNKFQDMINGSKGRPTGADCAGAYCILSMWFLRKSLEGLLMVGYSDYSATVPINKAENVAYKITPEVVSKYRRYFFNLDFMTPAMKLEMADKYEWIKIALSGIPYDAVPHALGLRYPIQQAQIDKWSTYARHVGLLRWIVAADMVPYKTTRMDLKTFSMFLQALRSILPEREESEEFEEEVDELVTKQRS